MHRMFLEEGEDIKEALRYPHSSLCYIADQDAEERERFYEGLVTTGRVRQPSQTEEVSGVQVRVGEGDEDVWISGFRAAEVWFVDCEGPVDGWPVVDKMSLVAQ